MTLIDTYTSKNETGCCAVPNVAGWRDVRVDFSGMKFLRRTVRSFLHIPINMASVMTELERTAREAGVLMPPERALVLSRDLSAWKSEQLFAVSGDISGEELVEVSGTYVTRVFDGDFKNMKTWFEEMRQAGRDAGGSGENVLFFYTTCPKCAKHYGHNYVIGLVEV